MMIVDDFPVDRTEALFSPALDRTPGTGRPVAATPAFEARRKRWALGHLLQLPAATAGSGAEVAL